MKSKKLFLIFGVMVLLFTITLSSASRLPTVDGDENCFE